MEDDFYEGRLQTKVKHKILEGFLTSFGFKVGTKWASITYIDGFSGPWESKDPKLSDTSFSIALESLSKVRDGLSGHQGKSLKLRYFFVEKMRRPFRELNEFTQQHRDKYEIEVENSEFEMAIDKIVTFIRKDSNTFPFLFVDPKGWTGYSMISLQKLFESSNSFEAIINVMSDFMRRFIMGERPDLKKSFDLLFGSTDWEPRVRSLYDDGEDAGEAGVLVYCETLRERGIAFVSRAIVLREEKDRTHFNLVHLSQSLHGMKAFKEVEKSIAKPYEKNRAMQADTEPTMYLGADYEPSEGIYYANLRRRYYSEAEQRIHALFSSGDTRDYDTLLTAALEFPFVWETDLKDWLVHWLKEGKLSVLSDGFVKNGKLLRDKLKIGADIRFQFITE